MHPRQDHRVAEVVEAVHEGYRKELSIIGVVENVPQWGPTYRPLPEWYVPYHVYPRWDSFLVVRSERATPSKTR